MTPKEARRAFAISLQSALAPQGFEAAGDFLLRRRAPVVTDWLAIAAIGRRDGPVDVTVNVGVHCPPLHRLLSEINGSKYTEVVATFSTNIGYLEESNRYHQWEFDGGSNDQSVSEEVVRTINTVAVPFCERFAGYDTIRVACENYGQKEYNLLRIPALEFLMGQPGRARELLDKALASMATRIDPAADYFRNSGPPWWRGGEVSLANRSLQAGDHLGRFAPSVARRWTTGR